MEAVDKNFRKILFFLITLIAVSIIAILLLILIPAINGAQKTTLLGINIAPGDAILTIDGEDYHSGIYEMAAGSYTGTLHKDGFSSKTVNFELKADETTTIYEYILNDAEGFSYFERSKTDLATLENIDDTDVKTFLANYAKKKDIINNLPILLDYYIEEEATLFSGRITDGSNDVRCDYAFCLRVDQSEKYAWRVKEVIELAGFNYEDYRIIYED